LVTGSRFVPSKSRSLPSETVRECMKDDPLELRVAWDDGHESVLFPTGGMVRVIGTATEGGGAG
jgi:hypothetical protein